LKLFESTFRLWGECFDEHTRVTPARRVPQRTTLRQFRLSR
jgi:hypothetical protein